MLLPLMAVALMFASCAKEKGQEEVSYDPTPFLLDIGPFPPPPLPQDNPLRVAMVDLGRELFHDTRLSADGSQSCNSCHQQAFGFSDPARFSVGVEGLEGRRQAMPIVNMAWHVNGFFWDGRSPTLRDQALRPIQDPLEMNESLENAIAKLEAEPKYRDAFIRAFGDEQISAERLGLAMEQFMISLVSHNARFDRYQRGLETLSESELRGELLFNREFDPTGTQKGAECFHCHGGYNFTNDRYMNNGLDAGLALADLGRYEVTGNPDDKARFKVPTLRNIAETAPYMHDGRFNTLREVIDHYDHGVQASETLDPLLQFSLSPGLGLSEQDKVDLEAFLLTLSDVDFLQESAKTTGR